MQIFGLKTCDNCRKAAKALPGAELVDVRQQPMEESLRRAAMEKFGEALLNTRSTTWRGLSEAERARPMPELLDSHAALMKRPLIVTEEGEMHLGWGKDVQSALGVA